MLSSIASIGHNGSLSIGEAAKTRRSAYGRTSVSPFPRTKCREIVKGRSKNRWEHLYIRPVKEGVDAAADIIIRSGYYPEAGNEARG